MKALQVLNSGFLAIVTLVVLYLLFLTLNQEPVPIPAGAEDYHLAQGTVADRFQETVEGRTYCYVTIVGRTQDGKYHRRTTEVNCWMWKHELPVGGHWQVN